MLACSANPPRTDNNVRRRSSLHITLVLIGTAAVGGCDDAPSPAMRRDVYANLADCQAEWGRPEACEAESGTQSGSSSSTRYYGPYYSYGGSSGVRPGSRAIGSTQISRGGFGASSSAHSSGG